MSEEPKHSLWKAALGVAVCALLWGSAFPTIKTIYGNWAAQGLEVSSFTRWWAAGIRFSLAGAVLLILAKSPWSQLKQTPLRYILAMVLCQTFLQYVLFYTAILFGSGSLCSLMTASGSFWWLLLAPFFGKATWGGWKVWGIIIIGAMGVGLAVYSPEDSSRNAILAVGLMLAANLCGSLAVLIFGKVKLTMSTRSATGYSLFIGGLGLCALGSPAAGDTPVLFDTQVTVITIYLAFVSATSFTIWNELSTRYSVSLLATYRFLIPISGVILSVIFIPQDQLSLWIVIGTALVATAMLLATRLNSKLKE